MHMSWIAQVGSPIMCFHLWSLIFTMTLIQVHIQLPWLPNKCFFYWNEGRLQAFLQVGSSVSLKCNVRTRWKMYDNQRGPPKTTNMNFHFGSWNSLKIVQNAIQGIKTYLNGVIFTLLGRYHHELQHDGLHCQNKLNGKKL